MAADNIYKLLEQLNDNIEDIRKYSSVITNDNKEQLITQLNNNISDIRKYSGYHPGENRNIISKMARRIKAKLSGQIKYDQAVERAIIDLFGLVSSQTMYNQSVERAIMDIYNIEARLHQYTVSMFEMLNDENYHKICDEKGPRIIQLVSTVNFGDAVGNDVNAIQNYLKKAGFTTATFAETIHPKIPEGTIMPFEIMPNLREDDILLYHFAAEDHFEEFIKEAPCKVVLRYHNVTPPKFFDGYDTQAKMNCQKGLDEIKALANYIDYGLVVSEFNKEDLISYGYTCPIDVAPILVQLRIHLNGDT